MFDPLFVLMITAVSVGFIHVLAGPDHYLPFIAMAKAGRWSMTKTFWVTCLSGMAHVLSSFVLGVLGVFLGTAVTRLTVIENLRGELAAWCLIVFGLMYFVWGVRKIFKDKNITAGQEIKTDIKARILFTIFVFGPCEPLIPIVMYPAAKGSLAAMLTVSAVFGATTIFTMLSVVLIAVYSLRQVSFSSTERYRHALAGITILCCGLAIKILGL